MNIDLLKGVGVSGGFGKEIAEMRNPELEAHSSHGSFSKYLNDSMNDVNQMLATSDQKNTAVAVGKSENLHEAMISYEKAESALKLLVQVRNKALEAYHEIMRMQA